MMEVNKTKQQFNLHTELFVAMIKTEITQKSKETQVNRWYDGKLAITISG